MQTNPSYNPSFDQASAPPPNQHHPSPANGFPPINEAGAREFLTAKGWPPGLQNTLLRSLVKVPIRFFICDDSGSMCESDGNKLISAGTAHRIVKCTRWNELVTALDFHAKLAHSANAVSEFRMLNNAAPIVIGDNLRDPTGANFRLFEDVLAGSPSGETPLCRHIREVAAQITVMAPQLRAQGQKAVVVIATDGEPSDGHSAHALLPLRNLPVLVIIRLCTDEERIVEFWNNIDSQLEAEVEVDVLDDLCGEAKEIYEVNPWLTYGEPMHRLREFGIPVKEIDLLDEKKLSLDQIRQFMTLLFDGRVDDFPHPEVDPAGFRKAVSTQANLAGKVFCPVNRSFRPWVDVHKIHGNGSFCVTM